jgi:hypothetical protein
MAAASDVRLQTPAATIVTNPLVEPTVQMTVVVLAKVIVPDELPLAKSWYVPDGLNVVVPLDVCVMYEADVKKATLCAAGMTVVVTVFDVNEVAVAVIGTVPKVVPVRTMLAIPF